MRSLLAFLLLFTIQTIDGGRLKAKWISNSAGDSEIMVTEILEHEVSPTDWISNCIRVPQSDSFHIRCQGRLMCRFDGALWAPYESRVPEYENDYHPNEVVTIPVAHQYRNNCLWKFKGTRRICTRPTYSGSGFGYVEVYGRDTEKVDYYEEDEANANCKMNRKRRARVPTMWQEHPQDPIADCFSKCIIS